MSEPCQNCAKGNGRFRDCVRVVEPGKTWELDFFSGGCANCIPSGANKCSLSKLPFTKAKQKLIGLVSRSLL